MRNGLIAEKRVDVNGKTTTRWVKAGADNKAVPRGIPAPKSSSAKETASKLRILLFPETQTYDDYPGEEYAVTINGNSTFYSPAFAQQTMERIPVRTLRLLDETLPNLPDGSTTKMMVAQTVYDLMREMYDMGGTAAAPVVLKEQSRKVSNACVFSGMSDAIAGVAEHSVSDHMFFIDQSVQKFENDGRNPVNPRPTDTDYSAVSQARREEAQAYVMADQLHSHFGDTFSGLPEDATALVADYTGQWNRLASVAGERGFTDMDAIRVVMDSDATSLSDGAL